MKAYVMSAPGRAAVEELPDPEIGDYDALVDILYCGICSSTDRMLQAGTFRGGVSYPSVLGHESVGRVTRLGAQVRNLSVGDIVTRPSAYSPSNSPLAMHWGGFAEKGLVTDWDAVGADDPNAARPALAPWVRLPADTDPEAAALAISFSETFSVACRQDLVDSTVVVVGTGIAGLSLMRFSRLLGAARVIGVGRRAERLEAALRSGATEAAVADDVDTLLGAERADVVFEASGQAAMVDTENRWLRSGGRLVIFSAPEQRASLDLMAAPRDASVIVAGTRETAVLPGIVDLIQSGFLQRDQYLTHREDLSDISRAFSAIEDGSVIKALIRLQ